jgi:hypothetical protein
MLFQVIQDLVLNRPLKETQLSDSGIHLQELDTLPTTEGVEHLFAVRLEMRLVRQVDNHMATILLRQIGNVVLLRVVCDQPVNQSQTNLRLSCDDIPHTLKDFGVSIKVRQTM